MLEYISFNDKLELKEEDIAKERSQNINSASAHLPARPQILHQSKLVCDVGRFSSSGQTIWILHLDVFETQHNCCPQEDYCRLLKTRLHNRSHQSIRQELCDHILALR